MDYIATFFICLHPTAETEPMMVVGTRCIRLPDIQRCSRKRPTAAIAHLASQFKNTARRVGRSDDALRER